MEFKAEVASTNLCLDGDQFTIKELEYLRDSSVGKVIVEDFDSEKVIGKITESEIQGNKLTIRGVLTEERVRDYIVPGYIIPNYEATCYGTTDTPSDPSIHPYTEMGEVELND